jgi:hypothetical protein
VAKLPENVPKHVPWPRRALTRPPLGAIHQQTLLTLNEWCVLQKFRAIRTRINLYHPSSIRNDSNPAIGALFVLLMISSAIEHAEVTERIFCSTMVNSSILCSSVSIRKHPFQRDPSLSTNPSALWQHLLVRLQYELMKVSKTQKYSFQMTTEG